MITVYLLEIAIFLETGFPAGTSSNLAGFFTQSVFGFEKKCKLEREAQFVVLVLLYLLAYFLSFYFLVKLFIFLI